MGVRLSCRRTLRVTLATCSAIGAIGPAWSEEFEPLVAGARSTRVLFYNAHLLPSIAQRVAGHRGQDDYRTRAIALQLHHYDLVGLCEVFESHRRREIIRIVQQDSGDSFQAIEQPKPWGRHVVGSGLLLLSRYPIEGEPHFLTYRSASRVLTSGWRADGLAAKGAIHARLRLDAEQPALVDCFLTHLESISASARAKQIKELAGFIAEHASPDRPVIVMGDLNVAADYPAEAATNDSEYRLLVDSLRCGDRPLVDVWSAMRVGRGGTSDALAMENCRRIDYVFASPPRAEASVELEPTAIRVEPFLDEKVKQGTLSDHAAVECTLSLKINRRRRSGNLDNRSDGVGANSFHQPTVHVR